jgi:predicted ArsR family transcriptional regulator
MQRMEGKDGRSRRFLGTTKGKILISLCRGRHTVAELAAQLGVTDNAVRAQLDRLQRDGLAREAGLRRGVRKPHAEYELTLNARELFPRAYEPVLQKVVDVLGERLPQRVARDVLLQAGRRLLSEHLGQLRGRSPRQRLAEIMGKLNGSSLGIEVVEETGKTVVRSCSCPVASVTSDHPEICALLADLFGQVLSAGVRETCEKGESPRCRFEITHAQNEAKDRPRSRK